MNRHNKADKPHLTLLSKIVLVLCSVLIIAGILSLIFYVDTDATRSRVIFSMFEVTVMIFLIFLPKMVRRIMHLKIPPIMEILFVTFCFCTLILGDVADFYGRFGWWDKLQHALSGCLLGILGYIIINTFNKFDGYKVKFSPVFVCFWVACFSMAAGALWEIMEFTTDELFGLNSQQYLQTRGTFDDAQPLLGHEALRDTMYDLMLDLAGSVVIAIIGFFDLKKQQGHLIASLALESDSPEDNNAREGRLSTREAGKQNKEGRLNTREAD